MAGWEGKKYFDGAGHFFKLDDDLLSIVTLKLDEDGDGTFESTLATTDYILYPRNLFPKEYLKPAPGGDYGGFASNILNGVEIDGVWGYGDGISATPYRASGDTVQSDPLAAGATSFLVTYAENFGVGQTLGIESEQVYIEDLDNNAETLTIRRAVNGTTAAAHAKTTAIFIYEYPRDIVEVALIEAVRIASGGNFLDVSGNPETGSTSVSKAFHAKSTATMQRFIKQGW